MPENIFETGRRYTVELKMDGSEIYLNEFVRNIRIVNSMAAIWPIIIIDLNIDNNTIIEEDIFGQKSLLLTIKTDIPGSGSEIEKIEFELLYIQSNLNLPSKVADQTATNTSQQNYQPISITTIPVLCVKTMTALVNSIFEEETIQDPLEIIKKTLIEIGIPTTLTDKDGNKNIDSLKNNKFKFDQFIIPPMSVNQMLNYINEKCGIYQGTMFKYCDYEGNLLLWNLNEKIKKEANIIITQPRHDAGGEEFSKLKEETMDGKHYLTYEMLGSATNSNSDILANGYQHIFITDPDRELYFNLDKKIDTIAKMQEKQSDIRIHKELKNIKSYIPGLKGYRYQIDFINDEDTDSFATTKMSEGVRNNDSLEIKFGNLTSSGGVFDNNTSDNTIDFQLLNLFRIGLCAEYKSMSATYLKRYDGKYILESSTVLLNRTDSEQWNPSASLILTRTNKISKD